MRPRLTVALGLGLYLGIPFAALVMVVLLVLAGGDR